MLVVVNTAEALTLIVAIIIVIMTVSNDVCSNSPSSRRSDFLVVIIKANNRTLGPLTLVALTQAIKIRLKLPRHAHNLHDVFVLEQNLTVFLIRLVIGQSDRCLESWGSGHVVSF